jgi:hypothetical protein
MDRFQHHNDFLILRKVAIEFLQRKTFYSSTTKFSIRLTITHAVLENDSYSKISSIENYVV